MNETIPYYGDLHIDEGTKKLILSLLRSIRSVVPVVQAPDSSDSEEELEHADPNHISNVLVLARRHSGELEGLFNPDELLRYRRYISDYHEIMLELESTLNEIKICRNSALKFASGMAEMVEEIILLTATSDESPEPAAIAKRRQESIEFNPEGIKLKVV